MNGKSLHGYSPSTRAAKKYGMFETKVDNYVVWRRWKTVLSVMLVMCCNHDQSVAECFLNLNSFTRGEQHHLIFIQQSFWKRVWTIDLGLFINWFIKSTSSNETPPTDIDETSAEFILWIIHCKLYQKYPYIPPSMIILFQPLLLHRRTLRSNPVRHGRPEKHHLPLHISLVSVQFVGKVPVTLNSACRPAHRHPSSEW